LAEPFFFREAEWIPVPSDFSLNIVQGKGYDSEDQTTGKALLRVINERLATQPTANNDPVPATVAVVESVRYGEPMIVRPRLGQGIFRVVVTDAYERRCAITGERTLPVLEAAHIKPYSSGGPHEPENGLLLRSDLHTLFDQAYLTVDANQLKVVVSSRIREEFENGRDYYHLQGRAIRLPARATPFRLANI
jgi:putative restriction endonuclease